MMEAGGFGNGVVVVVGVFEPGAVVELLEREEGASRSEGGAVYGRRAADEHREVGFDGLSVGGKFFAVGYTAGRRLELPVVAVDPSVSVTLLQPAVQPNPTAVGLDETRVVLQPPAAPGEPVESGLPDGVVSPLLTPVEGTTVAAEDFVTAQEGNAPVEPAAEPSVSRELVVEVPEGTETVTPQTGPVVDPVPAVEEAPVEDAVRVQLVAQAEGLLVAGAASRSVEELRTAITELGQKPIA